MIGDVFLFFKQGSDLLDGLERVFYRMEQWLLEKSWICQRLSQGATPLLDRAFPSSRRLQREEPIFRAFRWRQRIIRAWDQSWFFQNVEHLREAILNTALSFFARWFFLCGAFCPCNGFHSCHPCSCCCLNVSFIACI